MRIALINPETETPEMRELYEQHENLALGLFAAQLRSAGYLVELFDLRVDGLTENEMVEKIIKGRFTLAVFSVNYATLPSALRISQRLHLFAKSKPFVVLGGEHVSYEDVGILTAYQSIDAICRGEGEISLQRLIDAISNEFPLNDVDGITYRDGKTGEIHINNNRAANTNLDGLSFAAHDIAHRAIKNGKPIKVGILINRGCPYPCVFCNAQRFLGNESTGIRMRSPANVAKEIAALEPLIRQSRDYLHIYDATFVTPAKENRAWVNAFCDEMERRELSLPFDVFIRADSFNIDKEKDRELLLRLRNIGMISTYLGLEAGDDEQLDSYNKKIQQSDSTKVFRYLKSQGMAGSTNGCITFYQDVTLEQIQKTILFLYGVGLASFWNIASRAETLPGIRLNQQTRMQDRHTPWDVKNYRFRDSRVGKLYEFVQRINDRYEIIRLEDRFLRDIRDKLKISNFNRGMVGYLEQEQALDKYIELIQANTVEFLLVVINELSSTGKISDRFMKEEYNYIPRLEKMIRELSTAFGVI
ncbi:B12-binding domain-containing radical SAM protein [Martelella alba]|uniref:B12-binding domain-containing radical SAM protein n=1 Tax=Martelella alba TaxID=2590451 RepID=A0ABY2SIJ1_9HYPH|nr:radical SAM protein [Martelella alba]TKI04666.1 B12-binding domain-containing radical SAM protein [Martelella alba]